MRAGRRAKLGIRIVSLGVTMVLHRYSLHSYAQVHCDTLKYPAQNCLMCPIPPDVVDDEMALAVCLVASLRCFNDF